MSVRVLPLNHDDKKYKKLEIWMQCRSQVNVEKVNMRENSTCREDLRQDWELMHHSLLFPHCYSDSIWGNHSYFNSDSIYEAWLPDGHVQLDQQKGFWHVQRCHSTVQSSRFSATDGRRVRTEERGKKKKTSSLTFYKQSIMFRNVLATWSHKTTRL